MDGSGEIIICPEENHKAEFMNINKIPKFGLGGMHVKRKYFNSKKQTIISAFDRYDFISKYVNQSGIVRYYNFH